MRFPFWRPRQICERSARVARFTRAMELARTTAAIDPIGLETLARIMASPIQARSLTSAVWSEPHKTQKAEYFESLFFDWSTPLNEIGQIAYDLVRPHTSKKYRLRLGVDPLIPTPWHRECLAHAMATIGFGKVQGAWREDLNHSVSLLLPMGIGLVGGGNHSIATGLANGEGSVTSTNVVDISVLFPLVRYDGVAFFRTDNGQELSRPRYEESGVLFEIGRLMVEHGVQSRVEQVDPEAATRSLVSGDAYYKVLINESDAGIALTESGAALMLREAGMTEGSMEWRRAINGEAVILRPNQTGALDRVRLQWSIRRQVFNDISMVRSVNSWMQDFED